MIHIKGWTMCPELYVPVLLTLQEFPVGGDLEFETKFCVHKILEFLKDGLHLSAELGDLVFEFGVLRLPFTFLLFVFSAEEFQLLLELGVLWNES